MNIAFCINGLGLAGLGATITSLVRNCSDSKALKLWFCCANLTQSEKDRIRQLLENEGFLGEPVFVDIYPKQVFGDLRSLHGDWTPYGRLLLPQLIADRQVLYLDSDLIVEEDILKLDNYDFRGHALAAVPRGSLIQEVESAFFIDQLGMKPDRMAFNSGVLLFDLDLWRIQNLAEKCLTFGKEHAEALKCADQTILNALFADKFSTLPLSYNHEWHPHMPFSSIDDSIIHFNGSPKPWDPLGKLVHTGYRYWHKYAISEWNNTHRRLDAATLRRCWKIRRSYARVILTRMKILPQA